MDETCHWTSRVPTHTMEDLEDVREVGVAMGGVGVAMGERWESPWVEVYLFYFLD